MNIFSGLYDYLRLVFHRKYYSKNKIIKYQEKRLKKIYNYAISNSPFYKVLYKENKFNTLDDFHKLPIINKKIMMDNFSNLNTHKFDKNKVMEYALKMELSKDFLGYYKDEFVIGLSSGTSGNKGIYITPKSITEKLPFVFLARGGFPLSLLPYNILFVLRVFSQGFDDINSKLIKLTYVSSMEEVEKVISKINELKINILMAPPSFIRQLLPYKDQITTSIKRIMTYAEVLELEDKERFEKDFNSKVIEIYQASEGQMASACKYGHLHINEDLVFIELYDEDNKLITECNVIGHKMIITNLVNYSQPLIRYEMNDMIILDSKCPCGSNFRRIKKVLGRHDDLIYFLDSKRERKYIFPDLFVRWIIVSSENIREFKVIQEEINQVTIHLDLIDKQETNFIANLEDKIKFELNQFDIVDIVIDIKLVKLSLPKEKNKYKRFINNIVKDNR